ncbi:MAG: flavodoxin-dependent (E)-4-hydroxy-3-methylbut-2-enyl-diphosphate synthase [Clostridia bacterium]|nr:flavodoxin-dependent (E)-4-hydroxy-3-methylbut-2-enyl-diphosphate synthase [Clostridia bacterium]
MLDFTQKKTRQIHAGTLAIGGGAPISIQSMTNTKTTDVAASVAQIQALAAAGCDIVRLAVPDMAAARAFAAIREQSPVPLVADIHFDYRLAIESAYAGADKIRINPGNIGGQERVKAVADVCRARGIPIRIGVNSGSLERHLVEKYGVTAEAAVESAARHIEMLEACDFTDICLSIKMSDAGRTIRANLLAAERFDYPLHIGVTEAGMGQRGLIKSAAGIGGLLAMGVGDTIRVSLTGDPLEEASAAYEILRAADRLESGFRVVSCPTCGRTCVDLVSLVKQVEALTDSIPTSKRLTVAVMGCAVNGPGEAREADVGLAGGAGDFLLFADGQTLGRYAPDAALKRLEEELRKRA